MNLNWTPSPPTSQILHTIASLSLAAIVAYAYKTAREQAERLYKLENPVPPSDEEKAQIVGRHKRRLEIFYGFCFWLMIAIAGMSFYFYIRAL